MTGSPHSESRVTVLVIDDEPQIRRVVRNAVENETTRLIEASTAAAGLDLAAAEQPALIILDLGLPDRDGLELCRDLRAFTSRPIIVLSARHQDREKVALLDAGADDYVTKPFSTAELQARVRAQLRRVLVEPGQPSDAEVIAGDLRINLVKRAVYVRGAAVHLTPTEWGLMRAFATHPDRTLTHAQLFDAVWGSAAGDAQQYLRVYVGQLRRKIEADPVRPQYIITEPAVGYRFDTGR
jgi:two-component system, OmpR family, KDP operon response regulator KdpE